MAPDLSGSAPLAGSNSFYTVTNLDIYKELVRLREKMEKLEPQAAQVNDHESRIRSLEKRWYTLPLSVLAMGAAIVEAIIQIK